MKSTFNENELELLGKIKHNQNYVIPEYLKKNKSFMLKVAKVNVQVLRYLPYELRDNKEFMLKVIRKDGLALEFVSNRLKDDN